VTDSDDTTSPVSQTLTVTVIPVLTASGLNVSATEGNAFSGVAATGTAYGTEPLSATITWGDGLSTAGTVTVAADGSYSVTGSHTYAEERSFPLTVAVTASGGLSATRTATAAVADAALAANTPTIVIKGVAVALLMTFTAAYPFRGTKHRTPSFSLRRLTTWLVSWYRTVGGRTVPACG
jgi:hypothetical protein